LNSFAVRRTGFPYEPEGIFQSDDPGLTDLWPILLGGLDHCAHEQWVDCPYYEQLSYVGDNTTELSFYCLTRKDTLTQRSLELFDWSRHENGWVAQRYPSNIRQDSFTYAMLYPTLVRDHAFWRRDESFVRQLLPGVRALLHECLAWVCEDGLVHRVPGWSFIDWVEEWKDGCGPGVRSGDSSLVNLHLLSALKAWRDLEDALGEKELLPWITTRCDSLRRQILDRYWKTDYQVLADDGTHQHYSEHAQAWALLILDLDDQTKRKCLDTWISGEIPMAPMSIYFSHYALEALYQQKNTKEFFARLEFWKGLHAQGFCTTPERPEPSRSDCHGWGAHPMYHLFASIAGIRPSSPGFRRVQIAPLNGPLDEVSLRMPHPDGIIEMEWSTSENIRSFRIVLPNAVHGKFLWNDSMHLVSPGENLHKVILEPVG
jgi:hypothetical protein